MRIARLELEKIESKQIQLKTELQARQNEIHLEQQSLNQARLSLQNLQNEIYKQQQNAKANDQDFECRVETEARRLVAQDQARLETRKRKMEEREDELEDQIEELKKLREKIGRTENLKMLEQIHRENGEMAERIHSEETRNRELEQELDHAKTEMERRVKEIGRLNVDLWDLKLELQFWENKEEQRKIQQFDQPKQQILTEIDGLKAELASFNIDDL